MNKIMSYISMALLLVLLCIVLIPHIVLIVVKGIVEEIFDFLVKWIHEIKEELK